VSLLEQHPHSVGPDIAGAAGNKYFS
jgi:hypothetical protein